MWLVLFDIDGTLVRMRPTPVRRALQEALQWTLRRAVQPEWLEDLAGKTDLQIFAEVAARYGWSGEELVRLMPRFACVYTSLYRRWVSARDLSVLPGVEALLRQLQSLPTVVLGVLTGNLEAIAWQKLRWAGLAPFFRVGAFGSDHWEREHLLPYAWRRARHAGLPIEPEKTILIGDSPRDVACARRWGVPCIAVATGPVSAETLSAAGAAVVLPDLTLHEHFWHALYELHAQADYCH
ncbi:Phosphoglycolate phosphatase [bacterium HR21]|nr:Phosphoglycolate phosphatase [bacterium HR21]